MPLVDVIDQTYVAVGAARLRPVLCDDARLAAALGGVEPRCFEDRGDRGKRWTLAGDLAGTAEVWLEGVREGTVVHLFVQADPRPAPRTARGARRVDTHYRRRLKRWVTAVRDDLDVDRLVGEPPVVGDAVREQRAAVPPDGPSSRDRVAPRRRRAGSDRAGGLDDQPDDE